jgi:transcription elongation factor Elf1
VIADDEPPTHDPRLDKSKSTKIRCIKCNRDMSQKKCRKRKMEGEYVCEGCYWRHSKELNQTPPQASRSQRSLSDLIEIDEQSSCLRLASVNKDEHHCMICGIACRIRVPRTAAVDVYMKRKLFVP